MLTVVAPTGYLKTALLERLAALGQAVHAYEPAHDDLFLLAMKSAAIVYAPQDDAAPETFDEVLRAVGAPGSRHFVLISADGRALDERLATLRKCGLPYIVLKRPRLLEDALDELADGDQRAA